MQAKLVNGKVYKVVNGVDVLPDTEIERVYTISDKNLTLV